MKIEWEEKAIEKAHQIINGKEGIIKLIIDSEDCGCGDDGVTTLWYISEPEGNEIEVDTNIGKMLVDRDKIVYLSDKMRIMWVDEYNCFRLTSTNGIITAFMKFYNWVK